MKLLLCILLAILSIVKVSNGQIMLLNSLSFAETLNKSSPMLVFFVDWDCKQCDEQLKYFYTLYSLAKHHKQMYNKQQYLKLGKPAIKKLQNEDPFYFEKDILFCILDVKPYNEELFKQQKVQAVPEIRIYGAINNTYQVYSKITTKYDELHMMGTWVRRVTERYLPQFQTIQQIQKSQIMKYGSKLIVADCKSPLLSYIKTSTQYQNNLRLSYICIKNSKIRKQHIVLKQSAYTQRLSNCESTLISENGYSGVQICENMITNFMWKGLTRWSDDVIHALFYENATVVVLVCSNQSLSWEYVRNLTKIKQSLELKQKVQRLPIFAIADVHYNLQDTIRIKKFIGGYDLEGWPYPYPILAYLSVNNESKLQKSIYQQRYNGSEKTKLTISQWVMRAQRNKLAKDLLGQNHSVELNLVDEKSSKIITKIYLSELNLMLAKYTNSSQHKPIIFILVLWRSSYQMQKISSRVKKWWGSTDSTFDAFFYLLDLQENQLPSSFKVEILPAFIVCFADGQKQIHQGIKNLQEIKQITSKVFEKDKQSEEQGKQLDK